VGSVNYRQSFHGFHSSKSLRTPGVVIDLFDAMPRRANFFAMVAYAKKCEFNPSREQKNTVVFVNRIS